MMRSRFCRSGGFELPVTLIYQLLWLKEHHSRPKSFERSSHGPEPIFGYIRHAMCDPLQVGEEIADSDGVVLRRSDDRPTNLLERIIYIVYRATTSVQRATKAMLN